MSTIVHRMQVGQVKKTLIFGPLRVIYGVWEREARKWSHTQHLRFSIIHGTVKQREAALFRDADIYLCNYEAMSWLANELTHYYTSQNKPLPFQMVVYDEVTKVKNSTSQRIKGGTKTVIKKAAKLLGSFTGKKLKDLEQDGWTKEQLIHHGHMTPAVTETVKMTGWRKMIDQFQFRTGLTGSPAPNGYMDIFGQFLVVDGGERLGTHVTHFKDAYFVSDYMGWAYVPSENGKAWIEHKIADITIKMDAADYLELPETIVNDVMVDLPEKVMIQYREIEQDLFTQLDDGTEIELFNKSSVSNKCLQFCNGAPYISPESPEWKAVHDAKLEALDDILEESGGHPVLVSYSFKSDAVRIMERYKALKPVNITATPGHQLPQLIKDWNSGKIRLMVGHPACVHPSTQLLTEWRGWVRIVDVRSTDRVFDGVEFVNHDGCSYSGYKDVIDTFGIITTPDHKLLIAGEWVEACDVGDSEEVRRKALYQYEGNDCRAGEMLSLRDGVQDNSPERGEAQSFEPNPLSALCEGSVPQSHRHQDSQDMVWNEDSRKRYIGSELCRARDTYVRPLVQQLHQLLQRYERHLSGPSDDRTKGCQLRLLEGQLRLGDSVRSTVQQANDSSTDIPGCGDTLGRAGSSVRCQQDDADHASQSWDDCRRSSTGRKEFPLREEYRSEESGEKGCTKAHVYDLVNCGPRHRYVVRNDKGEVFISHNSVGHGVDGLQDSGNILVWFGLTWNLEYYEQMCARLDRQGQTKPVMIHRIMCNDTLDLAVSDSLIRKTGDQTGLKDSIQRYRDGIATTIDKPCFL